jgi:hypothetical protein
MLQYGKSSRLFALGLPHHCHKDRGFFMSAVGSKFGFILVVTLALSVANLGYAAQKPLTAKRPVKQVQAAPEPQPAPPPPPTLEQLPTSAPQVSFHNDQLMIVAHNSTLGDVLRAVRNQTGAAVEIPANATERVVGRFGPGPARDVLAVLLNGSHFNYVMLGSAANPNALDRVILTHKTGGSETSSPAQGNAVQQPIASQPPNMPPGVVPPGQETEEMTDEFSDDTAGIEDQPTDQTTQADDQQQQQPNGQPVVKTPEQLLQELQRQQQQQQQPGAPQGFPVPPGGQLRPQPPQPIPPQQQQPPDQPPQ